MYKLTRGYSAKVFIFIDPSQILGDRRANEELYRCTKAQHANERKRSYTPSFIYLYLCTKKGTNDPRAIAAPPPGPREICLRRSRGNSLGFVRS
uniref:Uncharacterized protein n=1 Tax=Aegilops tauschii subsp. strangulata TaxID=200361 RepID=A0A452ZR60_AEGTS